MGEGSWSLAHHLNEIWDILSLVDIVLVHVPREESMLTDKSNLGVGLLVMYSGSEILDPCL